MPVDLEVSISIICCLQQHFHSEHVGLSHSMRILIPLRALLLEVVETLGFPPAIALTIHCRVHEDNASALLLANSQHLNHQNKHLAAKLHHFWSHVKPGVIEVVKQCDMKLMLVNALTKPLVRGEAVFEWLCLLIMGWQSQRARGEMQFQVKELWTSHARAHLFCIFVAPPKWKRQSLR